MPSSFSAAVRQLDESKGGKSPPPGEARRPQGHVLLGLSTSGLDRQLNQVRLAMTLTLAGAVVFFAGLGWALSSRMLFGPIGEMRAVAQRMSESDLSARAGKHAEDELGSLADSLNRIGENLTITPAYVGEMVPQMIETYRTAINTLALQHQHV